MSTCRRDVILRLVAGIQRRVGISSPLPALDPAACVLCKQRQGVCSVKPLACRRTRVFPSLVLSTSSRADAQRAVEIRRDGWVPDLVIQPLDQK